MPFNLPPIRTFRLSDFAFWQSKTPWQMALNKGIRRLAVMVIVMGLLAWGGAWLWVSGTVQEWRVAAKEKFYDASIVAGFEVEEILLEGRENASPHALKEALNINKGDPILSIHPQETRQKVSALNWVKDVRIERRLPRTIFVSLMERQPMALYQKDGAAVLVDTDGQIIEGADLSGFSDLVILVGENAPKHAGTLYTLLKAEPLIFDKMDTALYVNDRRWDLVLRNGIRIKLPEEDVALALSRLARAQSKGGLLDKVVEMIDVRQKDRLIVRTKPGAVQQWRDMETKTIRGEAI